METIEDVVKRLRDRAEARRRSGKLLQIDDKMFDLLADRIEAAVKALEADRGNWRRQALDEDARANATRDKSSQVENAPPMNINKINNYDEMVDAWNNYVRTYHHGMLDGFFAWLFAEAKGEEK
jgi:hypothetical protein